MFATQLALAWRNVARNRRRSLITVVSVAMGMFILLFLWGFNDGAHNNMIANYRELVAGSVQIHKRDFFRHPKIETHISAPQPVIAAVSAQPAVTAWTTRLNSFALTAGADTSTGMSLMGVDPVRERAVSRLDDKVVAGRFLVESDTNAALLGTEAARKLRVTVGDEIVLLSQDRMGALAAERFELVGLVRTTDAAVDQGMVIAPLAAVQAMLGMEGRITDVVLQVPERSLDATVAALTVALAAHDVEVMPWYEISSFVRDVVLMDNAFQYIFVGIVVFIALSGIVNVILVSMLQRTREFGVLLALGTRRAAVGWVVALETMMLGVTGVIVGTAAGMGMVAWLGRRGLDMRIFMSGLSEEQAYDAFGQYYMDTVIYTEVDTDHLVITVLGLMLAIVASAIYPAWRAARLEPIEAIRHV